MRNIDLTKRRHTFVFYVSCSVLTGCYYVIVVVLTGYVTCPTVLSIHWTSKQSASSVSTSMVNYVISGLGRVSLRNSATLPPSSHTDDLLLSVLQVTVGIFTDQFVNCVVLLMRESESLIVNFFILQ